jgi:hypothetical protein
VVDVLVEGSILGGATREGSKLGRKDPQIQVRAAEGSQSINVLSNNTTDGDQCSGNQRMY